MALTAAQTQSIYAAVGLEGEGNSFTLIRFDFFTTMDVETSEYPWSYGTAKTKVDTAIAAALLVSGAEARLTTHIANYDKWEPYQSVRLVSDVQFDAGREFQLARERICKLVGVEIIPTKWGAKMRAENSGGSRIGGTGR